MVRFSLGSSLLASAVATQQLSLPDWEETFTPGNPASEPSVFSSVIAPETPHLLTAVESEDPNEVMTFTNPDLLPPVEEPEREEEKIVKESLKRGTEPIKVEEESSTPEDSTLEIARGILAGRSDARPDTKSDDVERFVFSNEKVEEKKSMKFKSVSQEEEELAMYAVDLALGKTSHASPMKTNFDSLFGAVSSEETDSSLEDSSSLEENIKTIAGPLALKKAAAATNSTYAPSGIYGRSFGDDDTTDAMYPRANVDPTSAESVSFEHTTNYMEVKPKPVITLNDADQINRYMYSLNTGEQKQEKPAYDLLDQLAGKVNGTWEHEIQVIETPALESIPIEPIADIKETHINRKKQKKSAQDNYAYVDQRTQFVADRDSRIMEVTPSHPGAPIVMPAPQLAHNQNRQLRNQFADLSTSSSSCLYSDTESSSESDSNAFSSLSTVATSSTSVVDSSSQDDSSSTPRGSSSEEESFRAPYFPTHGQPSAYLHPDLDDNMPINPYVEHMEVRPHLPHVQDYMNKRNMQLNQLNQKRGLKDSPYNLNKYYPESKSEPEDHPGYEYGTKTRYSGIPSSSQVPSSPKLASGGRARAAGVYGSRTRPGESARFATSGSAAAQAQCARTPWRTDPRFMIPNNIHPENLILGTVTTHANDIFITMGTRTITKLDTHGNLKFHAKALERVLGQFQFNNAGTAIYTASANANTFCLSETPAFEANGACQAGMSCLDTETGDPYWHLNATNPHYFASNIFKIKGHNQVLPQMWMVMTQDTDAPYCERAILQRYNDAGARLDAGEKHVVNGCLGEFISQANDGSLYAVMYDDSLESLSPEDKNVIIENEETDRRDKQVLQLYQIGKPFLRASGYSFAEIASHAIEPLAHSTLAGDDYFPHHFFIIVRPLAYMNPDFLLLSVDKIHGDAKAVMQLPASPTYHKLQWDASGNHLFIISSLGVQKVNVKPDAGEPEVWFYRTQCPAGVEPSPLFHDEAEQAELERQPMEKTRMRSDKDIMNGGDDDVLAKTQIRGIPSSQQIPDKKPISHSSSKAVSQAASQSTWWDEDEEQPGRGARKAHRRQLRDQDDFPYPSLPKTSSHKRDAKSAKYQRLHQIAASRDEDGQDEYLATPHKRSTTAKKKSQTTELRMTNRNRYPHRKPQHDESSLETESDMTQTDKARFNKKQYLLEKTNNSRYISYEPQRQEELVMPRRQQTDIVEMDEDMLDDENIEVDGFDAAEDLDIDSESSEEVDMMPSSFFQTDGTGSTPPAYQAL
eukprot:gene847-872_t